MNPGNFRGIPIKLAVILELDSTKKVSVLTTQKLLDFLGDLEGFSSFIHVIFSFFAIYISSRLFKADLISNLFTNENEQDSKLKLSMFHILFEPLIALLIRIFCC